MPRVWVDRRNIQGLRMNGAFQPWQECDQFALLHAVANQPVRKQHNSHPTQRGSKQRFRII